ncbi:hypothetical protein [Acetobacter oeni]|uniref:Uncharacterized protein n=1 Tax=Acetobacter oeni TaxID=304077 RepID=A0A511XKD3_9PROT|nr:hypothetical protein [Acetobacter oeni]MBB3883854.1 hypothetical protein [Acetobacter oeni]GBR03564.1 hypothetical protein AA21952_1094 [Acetobacter oeni LMG 21952]GEN63392.1 hypothetical protein AOE01nite_16160 [Acetobacter oeni]
MLQSIPVISACYRLRLTLEFAFIFIGAPLLILVIRRPGVLFAALWLGAGFAWLTTKREAPAPHDPDHERSKLFIRFGIPGFLITLTSWWIWPRTFLNLPLHSPLFRSALMVL